MKDRSLALVLGLLLCTAACGDQGNCPVVGEYLGGASGTGTGAGTGVGVGNPGTGTGEGTGVGTGVGGTGVGASGTGVGGAGTGVGGGVGTGAPGTGVGGIVLDPSDQGAASGDAGSSSEDASAVPSGC
jgi:hypothetical protein